MPRRIFRDNPQRRKEATMISKMSRFSGMTLFIATLAFLLSGEQARAQFRSRQSNTTQTTTGTAQAGCQQTNATQAASQSATGSTDASAWLTALQQQQTALRTALLAASQQDRQQPSAQLQALRQQQIALSVQLRAAQLRNRR